MATSKCPSSEVYASTSQCRLVSMFLLPFSDDFRSGAFTFDLRTRDAPWRASHYLQIVFIPALVVPANGSDALHSNGSDGANLHGNGSDGAALQGNRSDGANPHGNKSHGAALHVDGSDGAALRGNGSEVNCSFTFCREGGVCTNLTERAIVTGTWGHTVPVPWSPMTQPWNQVLSGLVTLSAVRCDGAHLPLAGAHLRPLLVFFPSAPLANLSNHLAAVGWPHVALHPDHRPRRRSATPVPHPSPSSAPPPAPVGLGCRPHPWAVTAADLGFVGATIFEPKEGTLDIGYCAGPCVDVHSKLPNHMPSHVGMRYRYLQQAGGRVAGLRAADCVATRLLPHSVVLGFAIRDEFKVIYLPQIRVAECQCR